MSSAGLSVSDLVGSWDLVSFETLIDGERTSYPLGEHAAGRLIYGADGIVSAFLSRRDRPWVEGADFTQAPVEARGEAALGFMAYSGRFELDGDRVMHRIDLSLYPEMVGTVLVRTATLEAPHLVLETEPVRTPGGRVRNQRLTWAPCVA